MRGCREGREGGSGRRALMHWLQISHCNWANLPHFVCVHQSTSATQATLFGCHCLCVYKRSLEPPVQHKKGKVSPAGSRHKNNVCRVSAPVSAPWLPAADEASDTVHRGLSEDRIMRGQWSGAGLRRWQLTLIQQENCNPENTAERGEGFAWIAENFSWKFWICAE